MNLRAVLGIGVEVPRLVGGGCREKLTTALATQRHSVHESSFELSAWRGSLVPIEMLELMLDGDSDVRDLTVRIHPNYVESSSSTVRNAAAYNGPSITADQRETFTRSLAQFTGGIITE